MGINKENEGLTYNAGLGVHLARKCIDGNNMISLIVAWTTVFSPVCGRNLFPGVVVCVI